MYVQSRLAKCTDVKDKQDCLTSSCRELLGILKVLVNAVVMVGSIVGKGITCLLLIRFRTLRTVPNILILIYMKYIFISLLHRISTRAYKL
ncbi:hypothetical protein pdam_00004633, partial [Pocillopora damicornis]